ncbi:MAG: metal-dependent hydrolase [Nitrospiraceae bacterium]|nr:MAG: metal-dependent hydrolase [Nitrospiraceae bacterium]
MASEFSHAIVALAMGKAFQNKVLSWRELVLGAFCSVVPDLDVMGFYVGIQYGDMWGHRGLTHSVVFAALLAGILMAVWYRDKPTVAMTGLFLYFFLCTVSHGVLDAITNGGLGVAFFSPFDTTRYFSPVRPVLVSPIGVSEFFSTYGIRVLFSEAVWIWLPSCVAFLVLRVAQRRWAAKSEAFPS